MNLLEKKLLAILTLSCLSFSLISQNAMMTIDSANVMNQEGLIINHANDNAIQINSAGFNGIKIGSVINGVFVGDAQNAGVFVRYAQNAGVYLSTVDGNGVEILQAYGDGIKVHSAANYGINVEHGHLGGIRVGSSSGTGISVLDALGWSMNIEGEKNLNATPLGHIAQIYNRATSGSADVLALKVGQTADPGSASNFVTFFSGDNTALGRIEGNGSGGVSFASGAGDFAEYLAVYEDEKGFLPGDVVGIVNGKVSLNTSETNKVMAITDRPIVVGNQQEDDSDFQMVSFIGQVPVRVNGKVNAGDWIVASGLNDGTGVAIGPTEVTLDHKIVGQAWESATDPGIKRVNTAVGLDKSQAKGFIIKNMQQDIWNLQNQIDELKKLVLESKS